MKSQVHLPSLSGIPELGLMKNSRKNYLKHFRRPIRQQPENLEERDLDLRFHMSSPKKWEVKLKFKVNLETVPFSFLRLKQNLRMARNCMPIVSPESTVFW